MVSSSYRHDLARTVYEALERVDFGSLLAIVSELEKAGRATLAAEGVPDSAIGVEVGLDLRYLGQEFAVTTPVTTQLLAAADATALRHRFAELHQQRYGHSAPTEAVELVNVRVVVQAGRPKPPLTVPDGSGGPRRETRPVLLARGADPVEVPVYDASGAARRRRDCRAGGHRGIRLHDIHLAGRPAAPAADRRAVHRHCRAPADGRPGLTERPR